VRARRYAKAESPLETDDSFADCAVVFAFADLVSRFQTKAGSTRGEGSMMRDAAGWAKSPASESPRRQRRIGDFARAVSPCV
jgi:hypothetical protein